MQVAEGVQRFVDQGVVNWYLIETDEGPVAVDAGFPSAWRQIAPRARELRAIVLTHAHIDHLGFAERARREAGVPVYVPAGDADNAGNPLKMAKSERSPLLYVLRHQKTRVLYLRALKAAAIQGKRLRDFRTFGHGDVLPGGLRAIAAPGHTAGHMALHLPGRDTVFAGDAIVTEDPYTGLIGPRLVARAATADSRRNLESLEAIAATEARTLLPGHGEAWTGGARAAAERARSAGAA